MRIDSQPLFTDVYPSVADLELSTGAFFIYAETAEVRSHLDSDWASRQTSAFFVPITNQDEDGSQTITLNHNGSKHFHLREDRSRLELVNLLGDGDIYVDITGLNHATWAPIIKACLESSRPTTVLYQEPQTYSSRRGTEEEEPFDLSEGRELGPLPGFESYAPINGIGGIGEFQREGLLLVLLGFEGDRFGFILNNQNYPKDSVIPVLGLPGFRIEFVAHAYFGNQRPLEQVRGAARLKFIPAHCPFTLAYLIAEIASENPDITITVAPIGTKPHALGAVLAAIALPSRIEIIYDHPFKKANRTVGRGRTFAYDLTTFKRESTLFQQTATTPREILPRSW